MPLWLVHEKLQVKTDIAPSVSQTSDHVIDQQFTREKML
jgi:hypothetical protein